MRKSFQMFVLLSVAGFFFNYFAADAQNRKDDEAMLYYRIITVAHDKVREDLHSFPLLVSITDSGLKSSANGGLAGTDSGAEIFFTSKDGTEILPFNVEEYDAVNGRLKAWVRLPVLSSSKDTEFRLCYGAPAPSVAGSAWAPESTYSMLLKQGEAPAAVSSDLIPVLDDKLTVEAWVDCKTPRAEALQAIAAKWSVSESFDDFIAYDAGKTAGLDSAGFLGGTFDGRYVYFSPQHNSAERSGITLRYDTHSGFSDPAGWAAYNAGETAGLETKGFYGAIFDGRYVYYVPRRNTKEFHTYVLRYDTKADFKSKSAWTAHDAGLGISYQSAAFDGRYIYFAPGSANKTGHSGMVLRYDTSADFNAKQSWSVFDASQTDGLKTVDFDGAVFDGRYIHFAPLSHSAPLRYDTTKPFTDKAAWSAFDAAPLGMKRCVGAIFDGKFVYFVTYVHDTIVRYDTSSDYKDAGSWSAFDVKQTAGLTKFGYDGAFFDGRSVYFVPFMMDPAGKGFHSELLRYDTTKDFGAPSSWSVKDVSSISGLHTVGYNAGIYDGRFFYFAPWHDGEAYLKERRIAGHGRVLRYDTIGGNGSFILKYIDLGHNGGLGGSVPGTTFTVNTKERAYSVLSNKIPPAGQLYIVGTYNGETMALYINGEKVAEGGCSGPVLQSSGTMGIGGIPGGQGAFDGKIEALRVSAASVSEAWVDAAFKNQSDPAAFYTISGEMK